MDPRYFWRRVFAFLGDLLLAGLFFGILVFVVDLAVPIKIVAPEVPKFNTCSEPRTLISEETMHTILPLKEGEVHYQALCKTTNGFFSTFYTTVIGKQWSEGSQTKDTKISYNSDRDGVPVSVLFTDPFFAILVPLLFAVILSRYGTTPARHLFILAVCDENEQPPSLLSALKREYLKWLPMVVGSVFSMQDIYKPSEFIDDKTLYSELVKAASDLDKLAETTTNEVTIVTSDYLLLAVFAILFFGFYFGSFIFWRGQTFWDRFARLYTIGPDDNGEASGNAEA